MSEGNRNWWERMGLSTLTRSEWIFTVFILLFCGLFTVVELNNHKLFTNDFRVYFEATRDFFAGNNPYEHAYGLSTGFFKYPPFTLYLFAPQLLVSYGVGQIIHLSLLGFSLVYSIITMRKLVERYQLFGSLKVPAGFLYLTFFCVAIHLTRELHMGNVNLLLLLFFTLGLRSLLNGKDVPLAVWWSLMLILKPIMILVILPLLLHKKWRAIVYMAGFGMFFLLFPILHIGWSGMSALWQDWFKAIAAHGEYLTSFNAIGTLVKLHLGMTSFWIVPLLVLALLVTLMIRERIKFGVSTEQLWVWITIFAAFIPNFFVTDTEHFLLSIPLIYVLLTALWKVKRWYYWGAFCIGMLCFAFNSSDLLGKDLSNLLYDNGFLGMGNLIFITTLLVLRWSNTNLQVPLNDINKVI